MRLQEAIPPIADSRASLKKTAIIDDEIVTLDVGWKGIYRS
jgi:hypothetical protein